MLQHGWTSKTSRAMIQSKGKKSKTATTKQTKAPPYWIPGSKELSDSGVPDSRFLL